MKVYSKEYSDSMRSFLRERSLIDIEVDILNEEMERGVWTSSTSLSSIINLSKNTIPEKRRATLELNYWSLDGTSYINNGELGFVSSELSDKDGLYETNPYLEFEVAENDIDLAGLTFYFDTIKGEYPSSIDVTINDNETTYVVNKPNWEIVHSFDDVETLGITINKHLPYRRCRLSNVLGGIVRNYDNDTVINAKLTNDVDPISRRLPQTNISFSIYDLANEYDVENDYSFFKYLIGSKILCKFGYDLPSGVEWLKPDIYWVKELPAYNEQQVTINGIGRIESLTSECTLGLSGNFKTLAQRILTDAGVKSDEYVLDDCLNNLSTTVNLPKETHANLLQLIAHASRCTLFTDDDNKIHIKRFRTDLKGVYKGIYTSSEQNELSSIEALNTNNYYEQECVTLELNHWLLDGHQYIKDNDYIKRGFVGSMSNANGEWVSEPTITRTLELKNDIRTFNMVFDSKCNTWSDLEIELFSDNVSQGTMSVVPTNSEEVFSNTFAQNINKFVISFKRGLPYSYARLNRLSYRQNDFMLNFETISDGSQTLNIIDKLKQVKVNYGEDLVYTHIVDTEGETDEIDNVLIDGRQMAKDVAEWVAEYLVYRNTYEANYRGNPEIECGDIIAMETRYTDAMETLVLCDNITFDGGLSGSLTLKGLI